jgi:hypothetical protein
MKREKIIARFNKRMDIYGLPLIPKDNLSVLFGEMIDIRKKVISVIPCIDKSPYKLQREEKKLVIFTNAWSNLFFCFYPSAILHFR